MDPIGTSAHEDLDPPRPISGHPLHATTPRSARSWALLFLAGRLVAHPQHLSEAQGPAAAADRTQEATP
jgi:hypothetical protein